MCLGKITGYPWDAFMLSFFVATVFHRIQNTKATNVFAAQARTSIAGVSGSISMNFSGNSMHDILCVLPAIRSQFWIIIYLFFFFFSL